MSIPMPNPTVFQDNMIFIEEPRKSSRKYYNRSLIKISILCNPLSSSSSNENLYAKPIMFQDNTCHMPNKVPNQLLLVWASIFLAKLKKLQTLAKITVFLTQRFTVYQQSGNPHHSPNLLSHLRGLWVWLSQCGGGGSGPACGICRMPSWRCLASVASTISTWYGGYGIFGCNQPAARNLPRIMHHLATHTADERMLVRLREQAKELAPAVQQMRLLKTFTQRVAPSRKNNGLNNGGPWRVPPQVLKSPCRHDRHQWHHRHRFWAVMRFWDATCVYEEPTNAAAAAPVPTAAHVAPMESPRTPRHDTFDLNRFDLIWAVAGLIQLFGQAYTPCVVFANSQAIAWQGSCELLTTALHTWFTVCACRCTHPLPGSKARRDSWKVYCKRRCINEVCNPQVCKPQ